MDGLVTVFVLVVVTTAVSASPQGVTTGSCPNNCTCDDVFLTTACDDVTNSTWSDFIAKVPTETKTLVLRRTDFIEEVISVEDDNIENTPTLPSALYNLKVLDIKNSSLVNLGPDAFTLLPNVEELYFNFVNMTNMTLYLLSSLSNVEVVDLSHNHIISVPMELLESWTALRHLSLHHNRITEFNFVVFQKASSLESLDLSNNNISFVHPVIENSANNRTSPSSVKLHSNSLKYIHPTVIHNLSHPITVYLGNNPWDCHCGMEWLTDVLVNGNTASVVFPDADEMQCHTPEYLQSEQIMTLDAGELSCKEPDISYTSTNLTVHFMNSHVVECNVSGYPQPSVYWITPRGPVVHPENRYWVPAEVAQSPQELAFTGQPSFFHAAVSALRNGSLLLKNFRYYFEGQYTCVAVNPTGLQSYSTNITIVVNLRESVQWSMIWGFSAAIGFLLVSILYGSITYCARRYCCKSEIIPDLPKLDDTTDYSSEEDNYSEESYYIYDRSPFWSPKGSPRRSPMKCVTPAEGLDGEHKNIREMLENVRVRLRYNMERHVDKIRSRAQNMRKNSHKYMKNMRHTTGHYMKNIKHTSSQYVHKVRDGVVLGVEQVKYHVQSIKEMCGTGDITHTISTVSISTDVDSQKTQEVVKTFTFV